MVSPGTLPKSVDALAGQISGRWHVVCVLTFAAVLVLLVPLAHASPPDSTWIAGIYDGADLDEVVVAVISATGIVGTFALTATAADIAPDTVRSHVTVLGGAAPSSTLSTRAPPSPARGITTQA
jgi:hypothetical protein